MDAISYLKDAGVMALIEKKQEFDRKLNAAAFTPDYDDLARLHRLVTSRRCFTVLEFGIGYSTVVIAHALLKNQLDWNTLEQKPKIRNGNMFKIFSVDTSEYWIGVLNGFIPDEYKEIINLSYSSARIGTFNGQLCHFYDKIPDIIPDFIYLDGPDPSTVDGELNGLSFRCKERTVMSGDLLLMEPSFLPGTFIIVDGRTNNVRFLKNNFKRSYKFEWNKSGDCSSFELDEERLGRYNILGSDIF